MMRSLSDLRRFAVSRSLSTATSLQRAVDLLGFVQADPIRAPARAQDLTLRHRVTRYRAGDLERLYPSLDIEEDVFINYGFVARAVHRLMHPRAAAPLAKRKRVAAILGYVRERGFAHPREVDAHFSHGRVTNYWGGSSSATTHLLELMHYHGLLRVIRRDAGIRVYGMQTSGTLPLNKQERAARIDALIDVVVRKYAPLPEASLSNLVARLRYAVPQWRRELRPALARAKQRLPHAHIDGVNWYWPEGEQLTGDRVEDTVRLLAPFDPVVWDRRRFEILWEWAYRFEAYTPVSKRQRGYYALPLLWRDRVIGWGNVSVEDGAVHADLGYVAGRPPGERRFRQALEAELERLRGFLA